MNIARIVARVLVGLLFIFAGGSDFFVTTPPPIPGLAGTFNDVFFKSHWVYFLAVAQIAIGVLLVSNRFVPVALIMLAAFLYNSFGFHITMAMFAIWAPIVVTALGLFIAWPYRAIFAPIFKAKL
jgi:putative oxidoreductase